MRRGALGVRLGPAWLLALALAGTSVAAQSDLGTEQQREDGRRLYDKYCAQCHGVTGDGKGSAWQRVNPAPRDFTAGKYKFRTTPTGMLPTDDDLGRVIRQGLPYTSMPAWPALSDTEVQNIIYHLKTFSPDFQNPDKLADPIEVPKAPAMSEESVARGREAYVAQGCAACHGDQGRGNGTSAKTLRDDWGHHLRPADMTQRWQFRGGPTREDIFRTFSTGVNGTPMPSFGETLAVADRWDLVNYIYSLGEGDTPGYDNLVEVVAVEDELDLADPAALFASAPEARFPLLGQITQPGRSFYPWVSSVVVQAVYNRREIAVRVRWHDFSPETSGSNSPTLVVPPEEESQPQSAGGEGEEDPFGADPFAADPFAATEAPAAAEDDPWADLAGEEAPAEAGGEFSDAVAIQLPTTLPTGIRKPYFIFGDAQNPVDLYFVDLASPLPQVFSARGSGGIAPVESTELEIAQSYDDGAWNVVFKRRLKGAGGIDFEPGQFVPIAFSVWDGFNRERGNKRALSQWFYLYVRPTEVASPVGPMVRAAAIALLIELLLVWFIRRRHAAAAGPHRAVRPVPAGGGAG